MKIKDVERLTGIPAANIRYYEQEKLLLPARKKENNYREYNEESIARLHQIKTLRALGIPVGEIRRIFLGEESIEEAVINRMDVLKQEEVHIKEIRLTCERILREKVELECLNETIFEGNVRVWEKVLKDVFKTDMTEVKLSVGQLSQYIVILLIGGLMVNVIISTVLNVGIVKNVFSENVIQSSFWIAAGLLVFSGIATYWSERANVHTVIFAIVTFCWPIFLYSAAYSFMYYDYPDLLREFSFAVPFVQLFLIFYVIFVWRIFKKMKQTMKKEWYILMSAAAASIIYSFSLGKIIGNVWIVLTLTFISSLYLGMYWIAVIKDIGKYNRFYAVASANRILNPVAIFMHYFGRQMSGWWR